MIILKPFAQDRSPVRTSFSCFALFGVVAGFAAFLAQDANARGAPFGGGFRGGGAAISRNGGFAGLRSSGGMQRPEGSGQLQRFGAGQRPISDTAHRSGSFGRVQQSSNANTGAAGSGIANTRRTINRTGNTGVVGAGNGNGSGNTGVVNNGNINNGSIGSVNVNTGNVALGNDVNVNVGNGGSTGYPAGTGAAYATGVTIGATTTAAVVGSAHYSLPSGCYPYAWSGYTYYSCAGTWYQQRYQGTSVTYVMVADPTKTK